MADKEKTAGFKAEKMASVIEPGARLGVYSNYVQVQNTPLDFRMDFAQVIPDDKKYYVSARVFMSPQHAKLFAKALTDNIEKFEKQFGEITVGVVRIAPQSDELH